MDEEWYKYIDMQKLEDILSACKNYQPCRDNILECFKYFKPSEIKVIILGQDPYYIKDYATGVAFACNKETPKSLQNIYKVVQLNYPNKQICIDNSLIGWVKQGVLLLNTALTVEVDKPYSHKNIWATFVNDIIRKLSDDYENIVYMLWGNEAKSKRDLINTKNNHMVLTASHPSPLSYDKTYEPLSNSYCFRIANDYLKKIGKTQINWTG